MKRPFTLCAHFRVKGRKLLPELSPGAGWEENHVALRIRHLSQWRCLHFFVAFVQRESAAFSLKVLPWHTFHHACVGRHASCRWQETQGTGRRRRRRRRRKRGRNCPGSWQQHAGRKEEGGDNCLGPAAQLHTLHTLANLGGPPTHAHTPLHTTRHTRLREMPKQRPRKEGKKKGGEGTREILHTAQKSRKTLPFWSWRKKKELPAKEPDLPHTATMHATRHALYEYKHNNSGTHLASDTSQVDICESSYVVLKARYRQTGSKGG